ncbi:MULTISPECIES: peptidase C15 [Cyanophyceae]|uniref:Peptidase C15 n=1 Tax=Nodularia spumigena CENA596 TaxID=1819295 RepID=A0A166JZN1_NODSP|nr:MULTISPECIES: peptidase C15 [Cyanophyceae]KZL50362.1 peptidase C15 [Nodularia spumigena CENA596]MDB9306784.1 peptidase C15 [Nodularia spumigena CS-591/12]MDB9316287.1 peptidase C15 [Nodularia spumigena CS-590/01A]MDB9322483.1 peptidase C15 [Nodularia spumigena CS-591/07A]MDB9327918.1 peptidase C15 [Nodularia spumigena CS-590/02]
MTKKILLTSFEVWLRDQLSNSSDDLLLEVIKLDSLPHDLKFLRRLPVDVHLASSQVIQKISELQPDYIICCGMAASRTKLSLEAVASFESTVLPTTVNLEKLVTGATDIEISHDCGKFVCEGLYYAVLNHLCQNQLPTPCIFVHVPVLNSENLPTVLADFLLIINNLALS